MPEPPIWKPTDILYWSMHELRNWHDFYGSKAYYDGKYYRPIKLEKTGQGFKIMFQEVI